MDRKVIPFPKRPASGFYSPIELSGSWHIQHETRTASSFGIVDNVGPFPNAEAAQIVADQMNADAPNHGGAA